MPPSRKSIRTAELKTGGRISHDPHHVPDTDPKEEQSDAALESNGTRTLVDATPSRTSRRAPRVVSTAVSPPLSSSRNAVNTAPHARKSARGASSAVILSGTVSQDPQKRDIGGDTFAPADSKTFRELDEKPTLSNQSNDAMTDPSLSKRRRIATLKENTAPPGSTPPISNSVPPTGRIVAPLGKAPQPPSPEGKPFFPTISGSTNIPNNSRRSGRRFVAPTSQEASVDLAKHERLSDPKFVNSSTNSDFLNKTLEDSNNKSLNGIDAPVELNDDNANGATSTATDEYHLHEQPLPNLYSAPACRISEHRIKLTSRDQIERFFMSPVPTLYSVHDWDLFGVAAEVALRKLVGAPLGGAVKRILGWCDDPAVQAELPELQSIARMQLELLERDSPTSLRQGSKRTRGSSFRFPSSKRQRTNGTDGTDDEDSDEDDRSRPRSMDSKSRAEHSNSQLRAKRAAKENESLLEPDVPIFFTESPLSQTKEYLPCGIFSKDITRRTKSEHSGVNENLSTPTSSDSMQHFKVVLPTDHLRTLLMETERDFAIPWDLEKWCLDGGIHDLRAMNCTERPSKYEDVDKNIFVRRKPRPPRIPAVCNCIAPKGGGPGCLDDCINRVTQVECGGFRTRAHLWLVLRMCGTSRCGSMSMWRAMHQ
ncbi:hypothetical protein M427DRAFT_109371 [Gonapodya prolifera JEL478]|uniref:Uncharacterized protein n=1 Tax=Gonapodya prolifera (strain JEL478) TaxID=1344416 RepID=A0A139AQR7_GONPJ|nr:hypothetical protein M427DRAFT_109371 [Gonapodya prolifera JEL478]|eukprot:KXS19062.1 hypothetical protein M427DRAFT_109371 [Gonapodya prolifera JEL478]